MGAKIAWTALVVSAAVGLGACGPDGRDNGGGGDDDAPATDGGTPDAFIGPTGSISGVVYMPGNGPGLVPAGQEIPVSEALVTVTYGTPEPIPQTVYCDRCENPTGPFTQTDAKGNFTLTVPPGTYTLLIQKGQFRLDQTVTVLENQSLALTPQQTTLPSDHDPAQGKWLPRVAIGVGSYDDVETIFGKMGIGMVDGSGDWVGSSTKDNIDLYENGGSTATAGSFESLVTNLEKMKQYHLIVMPCTGQGGATTALFSNPQVRDNIVEYVKAGGKWYVADWSAEWADVVWPEFLVFREDHDTAAKGCTGSACKDANAFPRYDSAHSKAVDDKLHAWLHGQMAPDDNGIVGTVDADHFETVDNYDAIMNLGTVNIGTTPEGMQIDETPHAFILGEHTAGEGPIHPLTVTFEPGGCGRVLYTTFHTTPSSHVGLEPQERVLIYLIGEIGICKDGPIVD